MEFPNINEIVLLLIGSNNKPFEGKTNIHKNLYILKEMLANIGTLPYRFKPHFYGPYSKHISNALDLLENSGIISSYEKDFVNDDVFEVKQTIYELTSVGKDAFENSKEDYSEFYKLFNNSFQKIVSTNYHHDLTPI